MSRLFHTVDVFSATAFLGNPLPVIFNCDDLLTDNMQQITRWMNLSETAFLCAPTHKNADYRVRIFTLDRELPFAGHPTLGSCHAWLSAGGTPHNVNEIVQECGAGLVRVRRAGHRLAFAAPALIRSGPVKDSELHDICQFLNLQQADIVDAQWADNGPGWVVVLLKNAQAVLDVEPASGFSKRIDIGLVGASPEGAAAAFEIRALYTDNLGVTREDPVTGSLNASVAQWLYSTGRVTGNYRASQGARVGRAGQIFVSKDRDETIWVGGATTTVFEGHATF